MAGEMRWSHLARFYISLNAGHDTNGNPRRVYVVFDGDGQVMDVIDEGYSGQAAVIGIYPGIQGGARFDTTPTEYRRLLKWSGHERQS